MTCANGSVTTQYLAIGYWLNGYRDRWISSNKQLVDTVSTRI